MAGSEPDFRQRCQCRLTLRKVTALIDKPVDRQIFLILPIANRGYPDWHTEAANLTLTGNHTSVSCWISIYNGTAQNAWILFILCFDFIAKRGL
jgi:hypothetical protein